MPKLRPFRIVDENNVLNMFSYSGNVPDAGVEKGTLVKIVGSGLDFSEDSVNNLGSPGASYAGTVSMRFGVPYQVAPCQTGSAGVQDEPLGLTLWDIKEVDENGQKLIYNRNRQEELQCVRSGQAVPIVTRGIFNYSGTLTVNGAGSVGPNTSIYAGANGELVTASDGKIVGKTLGAVDAYNHVILKLEL